MSEVEIERLVVKILLENKKYIADLRKVEQTTERSLNKIASRATRIGATLTKSLTVPLTIIGGTAIKTFADFDSAMTNSTSIMQVTERQIDQMRKTALNLSSGGKAIQTPRELAESYFFLASAGKDAAQSMSLLPRVANFATAGNFDMALATDLLTDAQSALGLSSKNVAKDTANLVRVGDVLVKSNTLANASVQQFSESLTNTAGASLRAFNKDVEEGVAVLAAYADQGVKGNVAGTNLSRVMLLLSKASRKSEKEHKKLGFAVFDNNGKMRNFADIVQNLEKITKGMSDELKAATLEQIGFEARVQQAILPLLGTSDAIRNYEKELRNAAGTTDKVANKQLKSFTNQMKILRNQLLAVAIEIGKLLAPIVLELNKIVSAAIGIWNGFSDNVKRAIVIAGLIAAALGPLLIALGAILALAGPAIVAFKVALATVFAALTSITGPLILIGAAIAAFIALFINWAGGFSGLFDMIKSKVMAVFNFMKPLFIQFWMLASTILSAIWQIATFVFDSIADTVASTFNSMMATALPVLTFIRNLFIEAWIIAEFAFNNMTAIMEAAFFKGLLGAVKFVEEVRHLFTVVVPAVFDWLFNNWRDVLTDMFNLGKTVFMNLGGNIGRIFMNIGRIIKGEIGVADLWNPLTEGFRTAIKELPQIPPREIGAFEQALEIQANVATKRLENKFHEFRNRRLEILFPGTTLVKQGKELGELVKRGVDNGIQEAVKNANDQTVTLKTKVDKVDAVEVTSAEAIDRILAFRDATPKGVTPTLNAAQQNQIIQIKDEAQEQVAEGMEKAVTLLGDLVDLTGQGLKKGSSFITKKAGLLGGK